MDLDTSADAGTGQDRQAVLDTLGRFLDALARRDEEGARSLLLPGGVAVRSRDQVVLCTPFVDFFDLVPDDASQLEERMYDPLVRVDDDIAMVWARYDFFMDGRVHHWGTNIVGLVKQSGLWRISTIVDNGRTTRRPGGWEDPGHPQQG
jgi:hypothetical protein